MASKSRAIAPGAARGTALVLDTPLSFWGGIDPATGVIIDPHHPQAGTNVAGRVLVMESGRGSSSSSSVLAEALRVGVAPAGIVLRIADPIIVVGAVVARELYGVELPVVVADDDLYSSLRSGDEVVVEAGEDEARLTTPRP